VILLILLACSALAVPGDGHWDRQFRMAGTPTFNLALRFHGNLLYTAGASLDHGMFATNTGLNIFDGTNWSTFGEFTGDPLVIYDFAFVGADLYVGGVFTMAGNVPAVGLAKWNGAAWSDVGGFSGAVCTMTTDGTNLYVGGSFTNAGGLFATNVARWDGTNWASLAGGVGSYDTVFPSVNVLIWRNGLLYAGGATPARSIARWDGAKWEALGSGIGNMLASPRGNTLAAWGNDLFVGGIFEDAGGNDSGYIAHWNDQVDFTPPATLRLLDPQMLPGNAFKFRATATERAAYVIEHTADFATWTPLTTNSLPSLVVTDNVPGVNARNYRMREIP